MDSLLRGNLHWKLWEAMFCKNKAPFGDLAFVPLWGHPSQGKSTAGLSFSFSINYFLTIGTRKKIRSCSKFRSVGIAAFGFASNIKKCAKVFFLLETKALWNFSGRNMVRLVAGITSHLRTIFLHSIFTFQKEPFFHSFKAFECSLATRYINLLLVAFSSFCRKKFHCSKLFWNVFCVNKNFDLNLFTINTFCFFKDWWRTWEL